MDNELDEMNAMGSFNQLQSFFFFFLFFFQFLSDWKKKKKKKKRRINKDATTFRDAFQRTRNGEKKSI
jgi:hypothetical protein